MRALLRWGGGGGSEFLGVNVPQPPFISYAGNKIRKSTSYTKKSLNRHMFILWQVFERHCVNGGPSMACSNTTSTSEIYSMELIHKHFWYEHIIHCMQRMLESYMVALLHFPNLKARIHKGGLFQILGLDLVHRLK